APAADGAHQVLVRTVGHDGHEVEADPLLRPDMVEEHLVVTVRADARRNLTQVLRLARPEAENHHPAIEPKERTRRLIRSGRRPATPAGPGRHRQPLTR